MTVAEAKEILKTRPQTPDEIALFKEALKVASWPNEATP